MEIIYLLMILAAAVIAAFGIRILQKHLRDTKSLKVREMIHKERMIAMERDLPMPEGNPESWRLESHSGPESADAVVRSGAQNERIIRLASLCLGLTFLFGGIGFAVGLYLQSDPMVSGMWGVGLIPVMIGIGLLLFVRLSRGFETNGRVDQ